MRYLHVFFLFLIPSFTMAEMYVVKKGDSLWSVARSRDLAPSTVKKLNDLSKDQLYLGQKLVLPNEIITYSAQSGDTLATIAEKYGAKISQLVLLNNLDSENLVQGQELTVPMFKTSTSASVTPRSTEATRTHTVSRGETLLGIALKYGMTLTQVQNLNNKKNTQIYAGEKLVVNDSPQSTPKTDTPQQAVVKSTVSVKTNITKHIVQPNQTLGGIALRYKVSQKDLMAWNNKQKSTIYRGESLKIVNISSNKVQVEQPATVARAQERSGNKTTYTVKRGDTLTSIATKFKVSIANLKTWNNKQSGNIHVNERLTLYINSTIQAEKSPQEPIIYTVRRGDTLDSIAAQLKTTRVALMTANNKKNADIYVGEKLTVGSFPAGKVTPVQVIARSTPSPKATPLQGIRSSRFSGVPLPIASSEIKNAAPSGRGADIYLKSQTALKAPVNGVIEYSGYINALQNVVILKLPEDRTVIYAGLSEVNVKAGQQIAKGDSLGRAGFSVIDDSAKIYMEIRDKNEVANTFYSYKDLEKHLKKK